MKRIVVGISMLLARGCSILIAYFYFTPSSVLYRYKDRAAVDPADELFVIFNPLRDRRPETASENFLSLLKDGNCEAAVTGLSIDADYRNYFCEKEKEHRLVRWTLADRTDEPDKSLLHYKAYRADYPAGLYGNTWIRLVRQNDNWKVSDIEAWY